MSPGQPPEMPAPEEVRQALDRALKSEVFANSPKLKSFLAFIINEQLEGRGEDIKGKTIATDVYDRELDEAGSAQNLVRVEARRLRRRLSIYYAEEGQDDPVRITIRSGGYAPNFERRQPVEPEAKEANPERSPAKPLVLVGTLGVLVVASVAFWWIFAVGSDVAPEAVSIVAPPTSVDPDAISEREVAENESMFEKSPSALLANSHIATARDLIYPPLSPNRVQASLELCEEAKELDRDNAGAYSCASRAKGFQAFLMVRGSSRDRVVASALADAQKAVDLGPTISYSVSALAWARFLSGEFEEAMELARRAMLLDPKDELSRNYFGLIASFGGDFDAILAGPPGQSDAAFSAITVARALFHTGAYAEAIELVNRTAAERGQTSNFMLAVLAASHQALGDHELAQRYASELVNNRAHFSDELRNMYRREQDADQLINLIDAAAKNAGAG